MDISDICTNFRYSLVRPGICAYHGHMTDFDTATAVVATLNPTEDEEMLAAIAGLPVVNVTYTRSVCPDCEGRGECQDQPSNPENARSWSCPPCDGTGLLIDVDPFPELNFADAPEWVVVQWTLGAES